jgi:hypothetical protein
LDKRGNVFGFPGNARDIFTEASRQVLDSNQTPIQSVKWAISPGVKQQAREANLSPTTSAEEKDK